MFSLLPPAIIFITVASATSFFPNSTTTRTSSSGSSTSKRTTTSHSLTTTSSSSSSTTASWQKTCLYDPRLGYGDCNRPGDPIWGGHINPYDTSMYPSNIVPPNPSLATFCNSMFSSAESVWLSTAMVTSTTYAGFTNTDPEEGAISMYFPGQSFSDCPSFGEVCDESSSLERCPSQHGALQSLVVSCVLSFASC
jgi:hypothetical protein